MSASTARSPQKTRQAFGVRSSCISKKKNKVLVCNQWSVADDAGGDVRYIDRCHGYQGPAVLHRVHEVYK